MRQGRTLGWSRRMGWGRFLFIGWSLLALGCQPVLRGPREAPDRFLKRPPRADQFLVAGAILNGTGPWCPKLFPVLRLHSIGEMDAATARPLSDHRPAHLGPSGEGPSVAEVRGRLGTRVRYFVVLEGGEVRWWMPAQEIPPGLFRLGDWWVSVEGDEVALAPRYPEDEDEVSRRLLRIRNHPPAVQEVRRFRETGEELDRDVEAYVCQHRYGLEKALNETLRLHKKLLLQLGVAYFQAFAVAAGALQAGHAIESTSGVRWRGRPIRGRIVSGETPGKPARTAPAGEYVPGELLGSGGQKDVYTVQGRDDLALAVLKEQNEETVEGLRTELRALELLREEGFPTVEVVAKTTYQGRDAVVLRRYAQGSKDVVKTINKVPRIVGSSPLLNERSISDLRAIQRRLEEKNIKVDDLQFLIAEDGRMVIADPVNAFRNTEPSKRSRRTIKLLIKVAKEMWPGKKEDVDGGRTESLHGAKERGCIV